ncbi:hypothetical protein [Streptomyces sp. NBC_00299]|uniref:hypothetical protein n=1 Tax=Streptomyces sp. NBC_00299 TaxID=2975705 RepID=UPI002E2D3902|nr:hypothetical protein [Streptomyces sp. NBC_00299]
MRIRLQVTMMSFFAWSAWRYFTDLFPFAGSQGVVIVKSRKLDSLALTEFEYAILHSVGKARSGVQVIGEPESGRGVLGAAV